jgi:small subunit ribosomal protein S1
MDRKNARDDEIREEESFEALLNESGAEPARLEPGQKVSATVVKIAADWIFIELGRKGEGVLDRKEFVDAQGHLTVKEGEALTAYFLGAENNELRFTTKIGGGAAGFSQLGCLARGYPGGRLRRTGNQGGVRGAHRRDRPCLLPLLPD